MATQREEGRVLSQEEQDRLSGVVSAISYQEEEHLEGIDKGAFIQEEDEADHLEEIVKANDNNRKT